MGALPYNDRLSGPYIAVAGQRDFAADFPLLRPEAVRVLIFREGARLLVAPPAVGGVDATEYGFTARLETPCLADDRVWVFSDLSPDRPRYHAPNGVVRTLTLEDDAEQFQAQLQERYRDAQRSIKVSFGESLTRELPRAVDRALKLLSFDAEGQPSVTMRSEQEIVDAIAEVVAAGEAALAAIAALREQGLTDIADALEAALTDIETSVLAIIYNLIQPADDPNVAATVRDKNRFLIARLMRDGSLFAGDWGLERTDDGTVRIRDQNRMLWAVLGPRMARVAGLTTMVNEAGAYVVRDPSGHVTDRMGGGDSLLAGLRVMASSGDDVKIGDPLGFLWGRLGVDEVMFHGLRIRPNGKERLVFTDEMGFVDPRFFGAAHGEPPEPDLPLDLTPLFGPALYGVEGDRSLIVLENLFADRSRAGAATAALYAEDDAGFMPVDRGGVDVSGLGAAARLVVRPRDWDGDVRQELPLSCRVAPRGDAGGAARTFNILTLGDSIPTYQGLYWMDHFLQAWGYAPTWLGTLASEGDAPTGVPHRFQLSNTWRGETKPGHELADFTYGLTNTVSPLAPGEEAAYAGWGIADRRLKNTLLKADDGSYGGDVRNGYAVDFGWYVGRHGLAAPDVLAVMLGTNDIKALGAGLVEARIYNEMALLRRRWRAYSADKPMVVGLPGTGREPVRDALWTSGYTAAIKALLRLAADVGDPAFHVAPLWAMAPSDAGYDLTASEQPPAAVTGVIARKLADPIHPTGATRRLLFKAMAQAVAYAVATTEP